MATGNPGGPGSALLSLGRPSSGMLSSACLWLAVVASWPSGLGLDKSRGSSGLPTAGTLKSTPTLIFLRSISISRSCPEVSGSPVGFLNTGSKIWMADGGPESSLAARSAINRSGIYISIVALSLRPLPDKTTALS